MDRRRPSGRRGGLLSREPSFRRLFLATIGSGAGTWLALVALEIDIFERTHSSAWIAALLIADLLPAFAIGIFAGPLIDRLSRRTLMVGRGPRPLRRLRRARLHDERDADRGARGGRRHRDRRLPPGRLCGDPQRGRGRGPSGGQLAAADGRQHHLGARLGGGRRARGGGRGRCRLPVQRGDLPRFGRAARRALGPGPAGRFRREQGPLAGPEGRLQPLGPLARPADGSGRVEHRDVRHRCGQRRGAEPRSRHLLGRQFRARA